MAGGIKVTPEQLHQLSGNVQRGAGEIDGSLQSLSGQIGPLVGGDWAGTASQQFNALWDRWQKAAKELNTALDGISKLLGNAGTAYAEAEHAIAGSFHA